jgi:type I restriction-modification system DNA methylase subunit
MGQKYFSKITEKKTEKKIRNDEFKKLISRILISLEKNINHTNLYEIIFNESTLTRNELINKDAPEDYTEREIIEPFLKYLGYVEYSRRTSSGSTKKESDYTLKSSKGSKILVESEPMNKDLHLKGCGIKQVSGYMEMRSFRANLGIATDGFKWVLLKYDLKDYSIEELETIDLKPFFISEFSIKNNFECGEEPKDEIIEDFRKLFSRVTIDDISNDVSIWLSERKRDISRRFYDDYIKYVFGIRKGMIKDGKRAYCLLDAISGTDSDADKRLFAVTLMNRLIFVRFLEDKNLVPKNMLNKIYKEYKDKEPPSTFYSTYLKQLFYHVFNLHPNDRPQKVRDAELFKDIPYLNGGLFRNVVPHENALDVEDSILIKIITDVLEEYRFALKSDNESLDPNVLGNVFEKTINYLTGGQKEKGAFYTGENITSFISKNTLHPYILCKFKDVLKDNGWKDSEINGYKTLEDLLLDPPKLPKIARALLDCLDEVSILDPACGSGHFLTSTLHEIIHIRRSIQIPLGGEIDLFDIKKRTIGKNIFGVDLEGTAVEIAKLRLWLNLIESIDASDPKNMDTLPNIEYNILSGNSLVGWIRDEEGKGSQHLFNRLHGARNIDTALTAIKLAYAEDVEKHKIISDVSEILQKENVEISRIKVAYQRLKSLYSQEWGKRAEYMRDLLNGIREELYGIVTPFLWTRLGSGPKNKPRDFSKDAFDKAFHWGIDFGNIIEAGGFDIVIGNPPYGVKFRDWEEKYIENNMKVTSKHKRSELAFMELAVILTKHGGYIGLIVPKPLAFADKWKPGRDLIQNGLVTVVDVSTAFADVRLEQMVYIMINECEVPNYEVSNIDGTDKCSMSKEFIERSNTIILRPDYSGIKLYHKLISTKRNMGQISKTERGLGQNGEIVNTPTAYKVYRGADISQFSISDSKNYLKNVENEQKLQRLMRPKIMSQCILSHLTKPRDHLKIMSYLDRDGLLSVDTVENTFIDSNEYSIEFVTCAMNSKLIAWFLYNYVFSNAIRTMHFDDYYISKIPLPEKVDNSVFIDLINRISKVEKIRGAKNKFDVAPEFLDEVNVLIYSTYGLSDAEIQMIEEDYLIPSKSSKTISIL